MKMLADVIFMLFSDFQVSRVAVHFMELICISLLLWSLLSLGPVDPQGLEVRYWQQLPAKGEHHGNSG